MKHPSARELYDYWNAQRGLRAAPERADIEPGAIRRALADTWRPAWQNVVYGLLLGVANRLFQNFLFANDDWFRDPDASQIRSSAVRAGAFALGANSLDAAVLLYLAPGTYTVQVSGPANANQANGTGLALVEIYESAP